MTHKPDVQVFPDPERLADALAAEFATMARATTWARGRFVVVLAGGETPRPLYRRLATVHRDAVPWARVHVFFGDERYVPADHAESNCRMAREALLDHVLIPEDNVHRLRTDLPTPEEAARAYGTTLVEFFGPGGPQFDLVLLGLGKDGHIASLFPGSSALRARKRLVAAVEGPKPPRERLTLTLPAINRATRVGFLVTGQAKAEAVRSALEGSHGVWRSPARGVEPTEGEVCWWLDREAAQLLRRARA
ncbi:MAG: 6-phosphogluconolactonase [Gemmatimonadetes bacterium]|nr:6-phosphogluconolactonase [Gemmatimonadota bacterium]